MHLYLVVMWVQEHYGGGTLEGYLGRLSHREVWLVAAELVRLSSWLPALYTALSPRRYRVFHGSTRITSFTTPSVQTMFSSATTDIVLLRALTPAGKCGLAVHCGRTASTLLL